MELFLSTIRETSWKIKDMLDSIESYEARYKTTLYLIPYTLDGNKHIVNYLIEELKQNVDNFINKLMIKTPYTVDTVSRTRLKYLLLKYDMNTLFNKHKNKFIDPSTGLFYRDIYINKKELTDIAKLNDITYEDVYKMFDKITLIKGFAM